MKKKKKKKKKHKPSMAYNHFQEDYSLKLTKEKEKEQKELPMGNGKKLIINFERNFYQGINKSSGKKTMEEGKYNKP